MLLIPFVAGAVDAAGGSVAAEEPEVSAGSNLHDTATPCHIPRAFWFGCTGSCVTWPSR